MKDRAVPARIALAVFWLAVRTAFLVFNSLYDV